MDDLSKGYGLFTNSETSDKYCIFPKTIYCTLLKIAGLTVPLEISQTENGGLYLACKERMMCVTL